MGERRGTKGLELWCKKMTEGYPGVKIDNMTTSWRDGLAFCAIIHHFRPELIDFSKLNKDDVYRNNELAFRVAEQYMGIPALLEPEDMVEYPVPDRLSILTYLSQFYQAFAVSHGSSPSRIVPKRPATAPDRGIVSPASTSPPTKMAVRNVGVTIGMPRREPCAKCSLPVFIAERLNVGKQLYHRTCFRCARCNSQLTLQNYYETETENQYCCETCPDEEKKPDKSVVVTRSLSDEEKTAGLKAVGQDEYSCMFETAIDFPDLSLQSSEENSTEFTRARSHFINTLLESSDEEDVPPDLPKSRPPELEQISEAVNLSVNTNVTHSSVDSALPSDTHSLDSSVNNSSSFVSYSNQQKTASRELDENTDIVTKEIVQENTSLVQARMRLFQGNTLQSSVPLKHSKTSNSDSRLSLEKERIDEDLVVQVHSSPSKENNMELIVVDSSDSVIVISDDSFIEDNKKDITDEPANENSINKLDIKAESIKVQDIIAEPINEQDIKSDSINEQDIKTDLINEQGIKTECINEQEVKAEVINEPDLKADNVEADSNTEQDIKDDTSEVIILLTDSPTEMLTETKQIDNTEPDSGKYLSLHESDKDSSKCETDVEIVEVQTELPVGEKLYPQDLNPFGDEEAMPDFEKSLNPFDDDEDDDDLPLVVIHPNPADLTFKGSSGDTPDSLRKCVVKRISYNPYAGDGNEEKVKTPKPTPKLRKLVAPRISLNPFWDENDVEEDSSELSSTNTSESKPRTSGNSIATSFGSSTSISSGTSSVTSTRKKKAAPRPPIPNFQASSQQITNSSPSTSVHHSPRLRKTKRAPLPPSSTPFMARETPYNIDCSPVADINTLKTKLLEGSPLSPTSSIESGEYEKEKVVKDEVNRNRQSQSSYSQSPDKPFQISTTPDKSTYGKWKRKKGQAPSRPIPQKRTIKALPMVEVRRELDLIEVQQQGLEKQGVRLEQIIREHCEGPNSDPEATVSIEVEDLILQLFEVVNEKNELCRRQAELMYLQRQQRLEEEHAEVEYQIRCLMLQPELNKTDSDKAREEELITRLVDIVERRNEIIECLEMDRVREAEEDNSICSSMNSYASKRDDCSTPETADSPKKKDKKKFKKKFRLKSSPKLDMDKDVDESESANSSIVLKEKKKKKFNIF